MHNFPFSWLINIIVVIDFLTSIWFSSQEKGINEATTVAVLSPTGQRNTSQPKRSRGHSCNYAL